MLTEGELFLDKYRIEKLVGIGGMGAVYAAVDVDLARKVAIKILLPEIARSQTAASRFVNEGRAVARVEGEHVARVFAAGRTEQGLPYMVLELLEGQDLAKLLEERGKLGVGEAVDILVQALGGVAEAHRHGIVHRDLKPANLFLHRRSNAAPVVKVLDFGVSKASRPLTDTSMHQNLTATSTMIGSPYYMSPEQLMDSKSADHRADIWSLGCILYEMLTGVVPFDDPLLSGLVIAILRKRPVPVRQLRPDVPAALEAIVVRCLERDPSQRIGTAAALARLLLPFATDTRAPAFVVPAIEPEAPPPSIDAKTQVWVPKRPALAAAHATPTPASNPPAPRAAPMHASNTPGPMPRAAPMLPPPRATPMPRSDPPAPMPPMHAAMLAPPHATPMLQPPHATPMPASDPRAMPMLQPPHATPAPPSNPPIPPPATTPIPPRPTFRAELPSLLVIAATLVFLGISGFLFAQRKDARPGAGAHAPAVSHAAPAKNAPP
ncbi:protein kinase domain-containing protein [Pendulispora albinea]|uniref:Protein kinase n=1 Tax=Pendulispora albinea TaxID=2741071 RepID=A0ABZ2LZ85_9BACT